MVDGGLAAAAAAVARARQGEGGPVQEESKKTLNEREGDDADSDSESPARARERLRSMDVAQGIADYHDEDLRSNTGGEQRCKALADLWVMRRSYWRRTWQFRLFHLWSDRLTYLKHEGGVAEGTIMLSDILEMHFRRCEYEEFPYKLIITTSRQAHELVTRDSHAQEFLEAILKASRSLSTSVINGPLNQSPLGIHEVATSYRRIAHEEGAAQELAMSGVLAELEKQEAEGAAGDGATPPSAKKLDSNKYTRCGMLWRRHQYDHGKGRIEYGRWLMSYCELRSDGHLYIFNRHAQPAQPSTPQSPGSSWVVQCGSPGSDTPVATTSGDAGTPAGSELPALQIPTAQCKAEVLKEVGSGKDFVFKVDDAQGVVIALAAQSQKDMSLWLEMIARSRASQAGNEVKIKDARAAGNKQSILARASMAAAPPELKKLKEDEAVQRARLAAEGASLRATTAAQATQRIAAGFDLDAKLLQSALANHDFDYETLMVEKHRVDLQKHLHLLQHTMLPQMEYACRLQKAATIKYHRTLLKNWNRTGYMLKPDFKQAEMQQWQARRGCTKYSRRWFVLSGFRLHYYRSAPHEGGRSIREGALLRRSQGVLQERYIVLTKAGLFEFNSASDAAELASGTFLGCCLFALSTSCEVVQLDNEDDDDYQYVLEVHGQFGEKFVLCSEDEKNLCAWAADISATTSGFLFRPFVECGNLDLRKVETVRKSLAPEAPPFAVDLVTKTHVYTLVPTDKVDQLRWCLAIESARMAPEDADDDGGRSAADGWATLKHAALKRRMSRRDSQKLEESPGAKLLQLNISKCKEAEQEALELLRKAREELQQLRSEEEEQRAFEAERLKEEICLTMLAKAEESKRAAEQKAAAMPPFLILRLGMEDARNETLEAQSINRELDQGNLVCFTFEAPRIRSAKSTPHVRRSVVSEGLERYTYSSHDAAELLQLCDARPDRKRKGLVDEYQGFRSKHSVRTHWEEWRAGLKDFMVGQAQRFGSLLTLLDLEYPATSVVGLLRLTDAPSEYTAPLKLGDVLIIWAPRRDSGELTREDLCLTNPVVISNLLGWLTKYRCLSQTMHRVEASDTEQGESMTLDYTTVYRKLFQKAIIR
eukprot:TRINITY_DN35275_c0_g1_i1.p1 TRINITY_DN35275_c0_g1~~TRINITY_DN35275_c0_g1_i1.p1  ORF type:complete len:1107 (-),score=303.72 TRINITY_DN35275_c0_g1_i1:94-3414(-)